MTRSHEARSSPTKHDSVCEKLVCQKPSGGRAAAPGTPCTREKAVSQRGAHPLLPPTPPACVTCHWRARSLRGRLPGEAMQTALVTRVWTWRGNPGTGQLKDFSSTSSSACPLIIKLVVLAAWVNGVFVF